MHFRTSFTTACHEKIPVFRATRQSTLRTIAQTKQAPNRKSFRRRSLLPTHVHTSVNHKAPFEAFKQRLCVTSAIAKTSVNWPAFVSHAAYRRLIFGAQASLKPRAASSVQFAGTGMSSTAANPQQRNYKHLSGIFFATKKGNLRAFRRCEQVLDRVPLCAATRHKPKYRLRQHVPWQSLRQTLE